MKGSGPAEVAACYSRPIATMRKQVRWLHNELPDLVGSGVLSAEAADRLRSHYGEPGGPAGGRMALLVFGVLGSLLVGAGIILLFAHNWDELSRPTRTVVALAPLAAGQLLALWGVWAGRRSVAWREGVATFITLALGAAIALVGQTYHIPGDPGAFCLTWMLLALPLVYLLGASAPAIAYLVGITSWAGYSQGIGGHAVLFWPLAALVLPHVWQAARAGRHSTRSAVLGWAVGLCLCVATGITLEKALPGLWIVVYSSLFAVLYLAGRAWHAGAPSVFHQPFFATGAVGVPMLSLMLTWEWPWQQIGHRYFRSTYRFHHEAAWFDYLAAVGLFALAVALLVRSIRRREALTALYGLAPVTAAVAYAAAVADSPTPAVLLLNAYLLALGIGTLVAGLRGGRLGVVNAGMLITTSLILARFFDSDFGLVARGAAFIALGLGFFFTNLVLIRRGRGGSGE